jgi:hypothetical protein
MMVMVQEFKEFKEFKESEVRKQAGLQVKM